MIIREYAPATDLEGLKACVIELQDSESGLDPRFPDGETIVDAYIPSMQSRCDKHAGKILVAEEDGAIAGYAMIWSCVKSGNPEDGDFETARLADLAVLKEYRRRGIARALIEAAENFARSEGAKYITLGVFAANVRARELYRSSGYEPMAMRLEKNL